MRYHRALLIGACVWIPAVAQADPGCIEIKALQGAVKTVVVSHGQLRPDSALSPSQTHRWEQYDLPRDARVITITHYSVDGGSPLPLLNLWPKTVCEFDSAGHLIHFHETDGLFIGVGVDIKYDAQGREILRESSSRSMFRRSGPRDWEFNFTQTTTYSGNIVTERVGPDYPSTTITTTERDPTTGRTTRIVTQRERPNDPSVIDYRYSGNTIELIGRENGATW